MRHVAIALLTLTSRILIHDHHWETVELCGSMLTLACAYVVLSGGRGICRLLRDRLHDTSARTPPAWCIAYLATIDSDMVWGQTAGVPRNTHAEHFKPTDEMPDIAPEPDDDDGDIGPELQRWDISRRPGRVAEHRGIDPQPR